MSSNVISRKVIRQNFSALLSSGLVGTGLPVQKVFDYLPSELKENGSVLHFVVCVVPSRTGRERLSASSYPSATFDFSVFVFVLYSKTESNWSESDSADRLDAVEKAITDIMADNTSPTLEYERSEFSTIDLIDEEGGLSYWVENISVRIKVM